MSLPDILPPLDWLMEFIEEDISNFDVAGGIVGSQRKTATIYAKAPLVVAGVPFVNKICSMCDCAVSWTVPEGTEVTPDALARQNGKLILGVVSGPVNRILQVERTILEILVRASSVASMARKAVQLATQEGFKGRISGTRKTTPGRFRLIEKYALLVGGADTHRYSLSSMVMLKDNHIDACGGISSTVKKTKSILGFSSKVEVECRSLEDAFEACEAGADVVMLDNFSPEQVPQAAQKIKQKYPSVIIEVSGGITIQKLPAYLQCSRGGQNIDIISMGRLTQNPEAVDISMKLDTTTSRPKL